MLEFACMLCDRFLHGYRYMASSSGIEGDELNKPDRRLLTPDNDILISLGEHSAKELIARYGDGRPAHGAEDERRARINVISGEEDACRTSLEILDRKRDTTEVIMDGTCCELNSDDRETWTAVAPCYPMESVPPIDILPNSSHRDGSIYKGTDCWKKAYRIADRNETRLEAMMLSDPTEDCYIKDGICRLHTTRHTLQFFSLKLSEILVDGGSVELYGYMAARDSVDQLLNYIFNYRRDDPLIIKQGSLLNLAGPKRGIELYDTIVIEYDMRIKIGETEKDDLQLIDGVSILDYIGTQNCRPFTCRIHGDYGAIDMTAARLNDSFEATVEVFISEVQGCFRMCLDCFTSGLDEEIRLFDGSIGDSRALKKSVVAVVMDTQIDLKFKVGVDPSITTEHCCSFNANRHGRAIQEIRTDFALISVKVTWSSLP
ncbi:hypothetical protein EJB05_25261 [Eragrostis curvula]|uniref:DUF6598 domain-containing protein n=1 Tax=Eragrostis curvula TaxID=38414 RepID=A0A5J9VDF0_9POAL|nr:hypothetical protein EJB05_25261 [Eragrostis curvula]